MGKGKHDPARLDTYLKKHANYIAQLKRQGFVISDTVEFVYVPKSSFIEASG